MSDLHRYNASILDYANNLIDPSQYKPGSFGRFGSNSVQNILDILGLSDKYYKPEDGFGILESINPSRYYIPEDQRKDINNQHIKGIVSSVNVPEFSPIKTVLNEYSPYAKKWMIDAYETGKKIQGKNLNDVLYGHYGDELANLVDKYASDVNSATFLDIGEKGNPFPKYVKAQRYGEIPEAGRSYNFRDQRPEKGVSVMNIIGDEPTHDAMMYKMFNSKGKELNNVEGFHVGYGSDGEPLLLGAIKSNN